MVASGISRMAMSRLRFTNCGQSFNDQDRMPRGQKDVSPVRTRSVAGRLRCWFAGFESQIRSR